MWSIKKQTKQFEKKNILFKSVNYFMDYHIVNKSPQINSRPPKKKTLLMVTSLLGIVVCCIIRRVLVCMLCNKRVLVLAKGVVMQCRML